MSKAEKENRINSLAVTFLEQQQIIPHPFAEMIISAYKEGYHQAEKDLELTWEDIAVINDIVTKMLNDCCNNILYDAEKDFCQEILKRLKKGKENKL